MGAVFAVLLFYASYKDVKTRTISNLLCLAICVLATVRVIFGNLFIGSAILGCIAAALPFFAADLVMKDCVGGGDIKLLFSAGLMVGSEGTAIMLVVACTFFLLFAVFKRCVKKSDEKSAPFAPFITAGAVISYIILML